MKIKPNEPSGPGISPSTVDDCREPDVSQMKAGASVRLKQILVPIDFSDCSFRSLDYAAALALPFAAKLTLLHIVEPAIYQESYLGLTPPLDEANQNLMKAAQERLAALAKKRVSTRISTEMLVRMGRAHSEIPDTAQALAADMIVMGTQGYTGLKHVVMGSTAERVVRHASCPVLTIRLSAALEK